MEHVFRLLFPQMMDEQNGEAQPVCQPFQHGHVPVVVCVGGVVDGPNHLQSVDDDQHCAGVFH